MPNVVKILRSTTAGASPAMLVSGQIAINEADGKLFWLDANGVTIRSITLKDLDTVVSTKLAAANNLSDLANTATARGNLGLGSAALLTAGVSANNVVQLDGSARLPAVNGSQLTNVSAFNASNLAGIAGSSYALKSDVPLLLAAITGSGVGALAKADCFSADYKFYDVVLENIRGSVNGAGLYMQFYIGAYQASGYSSYTAIWNPGGAAGYYYTTFIDLTGGGRLVNNATWGGVCGVLSFINPVQSAYAPNMIGRTSFADATYGPYAAWTHISAMRTSIGPVTGFQIYPSSGTITGTVKVYGRA
jgi:hypothetical protein